MNKPAFHIAALSILLGISTAPLAHQLAFDKLVPASQRVNTKTSFELNEQQIIKQYHYRAKYFDIEKWMMSQKLTLRNNHTEAPMAQTKQFHQGEIELAEFGGFHGVVDPFNQMQLSNTNTIATNSVTNRINIAGLVAVSLCNAYAAINIDSTKGTLKPKFIAPNSFLLGINTPTASQSEYSLAEGIKFSCVSPINVNQPLPRERVKDIKQLRKPAVKHQGN